MSLLAFGSYFMTQAYFTDTAVSGVNTFTAVDDFGGNEEEPPATPSATVVINEVYYDVCTPASTCGNNPQNEWIELYNPTNNSIDLTGWSLTDNTFTDVLPSGTIIPSGGFIVVTPEVETFNYWSVPTEKQVILGSHIGNGLNDTGDKVILKNASNTEVDSMSYGDDISKLNPSATDVAKGHSLERNPVGHDTGNASDFVDKSSPTPGN